MMGEACNQDETGLRRLIPMSMERAAKTIEQEPPHGFYEHNPPAHRVKVGLLPREYKEPSRRQRGRPPDTAC